MPGHSRRHPEIHVHLISNVSRGFIPVSRSAVYRGGSWVRRMGRRVGSWVGAGIKLFGGGGGGDEHGAFPRLGQSRGGAGGGRGGEL